MWNILFGIAFFVGTVATVPCPSGWFSAPGVSQTCYKIGRKTTNFRRAMKKCEKIGGQLVVIDSAEEDSMLSGKLQKPFWIGMKANHTNNLFYWINDPTTNASYTRWQAGEPNNHREGENCVGVYPTGWNDIPCWKTIYRICERNPITTPSPTTTTPSPPSTVNDEDYCINYGALASQPDSIFSASNGVASYAKFGSFGLYVPSGNISAEWLQVSLPSAATVCSICTGPDMYGEFLLTFMVQYSTDGSNWVTVKADDNSDKIFPGGSVSQKIKRNDFSPPLQAAYFRLVPLTAHSSGLSFSTTLDLVYC